MGVPPLLIISPPLDVMLRCRLLLRPQLHVPVPLGLLPQLDVLLSLGLLRQADMPVPVLR